MLVHTVRECISAIDKSRREMQFVSLRVCTLSLNSVLELRHKLCMGPTASKRRRVVHLSKQDTATRLLSSVLFPSRGVTCLQEPQGLHSTFCDLRGAHIPVAIPKKVGTAANVQGTWDCVVEGWLQLAAWGYLWPLCTNSWSCICETTAL